MLCERNTRRARLRIARSQRANIRKTVWRKYRSQKNTYAFTTKELRYEDLLLPSHVVLLSYSYDHDPWTQSRNTVFDTGNMARIFRAGGRMTPHKHCKFDKCRGYYSLDCAREQRDADLSDELAKDCKQCSCYMCEGNTQ